jgi:hypothetical protein
MSDTMPRGDTSHLSRQVTNVSLRKKPMQKYGGPMGTFNSSLIWHMQHHRVTSAQLSAGTDLSVDMIKKLRTRPEGTTSAEAANRIAGFFGKDLSQFLALEEVGAEDEFKNLFPLLTPEEKTILTAQIRGLVAGRDSK